MKFFAMPLRNSLLLLIALGLVACGFHMRGMTQMSFKTLYFQSGGSAALQKELRHALTRNGITIASSAEDADMLVELTGERNEKNILSLSGGGKVREYELVYRITMRTRAASSPLWSTPQVVESRRDYSYDDTQVLAKEGEEARLNSDMRSDVSREIMRHLSAIKAQPAATQ